MALPGFLRVVDEVEEEEERPAADDHQFDDDEPAQYERDPQPSGRKQRKAYKKPESTLVLTRRVGNELAGCIQMGAALWEFSGDHCCAPILDAQSKELGRAIAEILRRYPTLLERIGESELISLMMQATLLTKAIKPVVEAVYKNHIAAGQEPDGEHFSQFAPYRPAGHEHAA